MRVTQEQLDELVKGARHDMGDTVTTVAAHPDLIHGVMIPDGIRLLTDPRLPRYDVYVGDDSIVEWFEEWQS